jgi:DNA-binding transcriptional ArsR family regulator
VSTEHPRSLSGDELIQIFATLSNPHRLRVLAVLARDGRKYVSQLARELGISRPLLHMHLQRLESVELVTGSLELSSDGKAMKYYEAASFAFEVTPASIALADETLSDETFSADGRGKYQRRPRRETTPQNNTKETK